ncbi:aminoglycoside phosphotransferase family protein [Planomicrobium sp. CPCC 101079]|uniref:aminoglycoside phosphotransferase family protein n=1 Tax=Planomicrobium sp. CPCC 101079 TaxID=2599618 RepID=UPI0011B5FBF1|nr:aminoglycoside phosphotransferase family protein [Planomicrobium sp. CPCC 101079]TWT02495.1 aminoglycoside phosphotransferase family protein [Planomicrobium sp. CPCC 101079]
MVSIGPSALPGGILTWVMESIGEGAEIRHVQPLAGGTSSTLRELTVCRNGELSSYVLRLFSNKEWLGQEPDLAWHEAESLRYMRQSGVTVPNLIAYDETGERCGLPATLMTKIRGAVVLRPTDENQWIDGLALALAKIHQTNGENFPFEHFSYNDALTLEKPLWSKVPNDWMRAFYIVAGIRPQTKFSFIHRDYHPSNVLWEGGKVSGVVDWVNACLGPIGVDVGHCRVNLAQLYGVSVADRFLEAYQRCAGESYSYHPYWDLLSLIDTLDGPPSVYAGWVEFSMSGLSDELVQHRLDDYLLNLLDRFDDF